MGPRPFPSAQLDRINNDDDYHPRNCRWVTPLENAQNSSRVRLLEYDGMTMSVAEWARYLGVKPHVLYSRLHYDWPVERVLSEPLHHLKRPIRSTIEKAPPSVVIITRPRPPR
jgi:hypothetical protein